jgi:DNA-binding MurR/RpiR family transcriptional regulator
MTTGDHDEISEDTRELAARVRDRAAGMPTAEQLASMTADVLSATGGDMSPDEIRRLAADALTNAQRVSYLLGRLAGLLDSPGEP